MKTLDLKHELHKQIDSMDKVHLSYLYGNLRNFIQGEVDENHWDRLSIQEKEGILEGLKQAESGQVIPHEVVMKNIKKKYGIM